MTFTLVTHLREQISALIREKLELQRKAEEEKNRLALEVCTYFDLTIFKHSLSESARRKRSVLVERL